MRNKKAMETKSRFDNHKHLKINSSDVELRVTSMNCCIFYFRFCFQNASLTNIQNTIISSKYDTGNLAIDTMSVIFEEITQRTNF